MKWKQLFFFLIIKLISKITNFNAKYIKICLSTTKIRKRKKSSILCYNLILKFYQKIFRNPAMIRKKGKRSIFIRTICNLLKYINSRRN